MEIAIGSTIEYIGFHAARRPESIAIVLNGRAVSYRTFDLEIGKMVMALRQLGLKQGQSVAVETSNTYLHWLILLAFDVLGIATMSYDDSETPFIADTLAGMDMVMCPKEKSPANVRRIHHTDQSWLDSILTLQPVLPTRPECTDPDAPLRIVKSSGTTGSLKVMVHTRAIHETRLSRSQNKIGFSADSRYLVAMGFSVQAFHLEATSCIREGGTCVFEVRYPLHKALVMHAITDILLLPTTLISMLGALPSTYAKTPGLRIYVLGGAVSKNIHDRVTTLLNAGLHESYGTNESGAVCRMDADGAGTIISGVQLETVDDEDKPVTGEPGAVRIKSDSLVSGYLNNPESGQKMFRGGWFYPGDVGVIEQDGRLRLVGRADDLLNIRGIKFAPQALEEKLLTELPVSDICLSVLEDDEGIAKVWVVLVLNDHDSMAYVQEHIVALLPPMFGAVKLTTLNAIPRTTTGKIRRADLNQKLQALQQRR